MEWLQTVKWGEICPGVCTEETELITYFTVTDPEDMKC